MEKWAIRPDPAPFDPRRHVLLLKGNMKDVSSILRKFGSLCGRPAKAETPEGYNFSLYLHGLTQLGMERISATLNEMSPRLAPAPAPATSPAAVRELDHGTVPAIEEAPVESAAQAPALETPAVELEPPPPPAEEELPTPPPREAPQAEPQEAKPPELIPLSPVEPPEEKIPPPAKLEPEPAPPPPTPPPVAEPLPLTPAVSVPGKPLWGVQLALDPARSFDSLLVGAYNRFAHAASTSVVSSPGTMYNPLFLYGAPGLGKTHLLHAIGQGLAQSLTAEGVVLTTGARLARAATAALAEGRFPELEQFMVKAKALIVDDIHLLAVTDQNRAALARVFELFFSKNHQVVLSSLYPPRALGVMEEALKISLGRGWSVDLKVPSPVVQVDILQAFFDKNAPAGSITGDEVKKFHEMLGNNYFEATRWLRRAVALLKASVESGSATRMDELLPLLFAPDVPPGEAELPSPAELESVRGFAPPPPGTGAQSLAVMLPKGHEDMSKWVLSRFYEAAAKYKLRQTYRHVLLDSYDASQPFGVPFFIGETCSRAGAQAALIVGPPNESPLATKAAEFAHAVGHILDSFDVAVGWMAHRGTMCPPNFLRAHLDFMRPS